MKNGFKQRPEEVMKILKELINDGISSSYIAKVTGLNYGSVLINHREGVYDRVYKKLLEFYSQKDFHKTKNDMIKMQTNVRWDTPAWKFEEMGFGYWEINRIKRR